jgi:superfamily II DNA helicase RecQ
VIFPNACHLASTATCTEQRKNEMTDTLQYRKYTCVSINPDRPNIYISKRSRLPNIKN